ncbi:MAG: divalent metal cation transporter [Gammaproteobacteria bacterium]|nr:divalent metal cation transporter [Gammaproteobacteria bacterium]
MKLKSRFFTILGPGLLMAAASIGVSHLVQSTRAGALHGMDLLLFILLAFVMKYPTFRFGHEYAHATGQHLLTGFRRQGTWAVLLCGMIIFCMMFTGFAAVLLVTSGLAVISFGPDLPIGLVAACLCVFSGTCLVVGQYRWMDGVIKVLLIALLLSTLVATALSVPLIEWQQADILTPDIANRASLLFLAALIGFMPAPFETCLWQSLWVLEKDKQDSLSGDEVRMDFHVGYFSTLLTAVCFLMLGAAVMHGSGLQFSSSSAGFAAQLINIYTSLLGQWTQPVIAVAAFAVMLSTVLVIHDGYPRTVCALVDCFRKEKLPEKQWFRIYFAAILAMVLVSLPVIMYFTRSFKTLIDIATTLAFLTAPVLAWLIHRAMHSEDVPAAMKPGPGLTRYSVACIWALALFAVFYLVLIIGGRI